jgi:hypothetical protein
MRLPKTPPLSRLGLILLIVLNGCDKPNTVTTPTPQPTTTVTTTPAPAPNLCTGATWSPQTVSAPSGGGSYTLSVTAPANCQWMAYFEGLGYSARRPSMRNGLRASGPRDRAARVSHRRKLRDRSIIRYRSLRARQRCHAEPSGTGSLLRRHLAVGRVWDTDSNAHSNTSSYDFDESALVQRDQRLQSSCFPKVS